MRGLLLMAFLGFIAACGTGKPATESADTAQAAPPAAIDTGAQASDTTRQLPDTTRRDSVP